MGVVIALIITALWASHVSYLLVYVSPDLTSALFYVHFFLQTYLYTGLFITGHDAMHRTVSKNKTINDIIGYIVVMLYAGMWYKRLITNHYKHHRYPTTSNDPDFCMQSQNFWVWWFNFMIRYLTIWQILIMAVLYNVFKLFTSETAIICWWVLPAIVSTLQLFYFGTYIPHRKPHTDDMQPHNARTQAANHWWAMLSCYFFGYHHEHHQSPQTPWWQLYKTK